MEFNFGMELEEAPPWAARLSSQGAGAQWHLNEGMELEVAPPLAERLSSKGEGAQWHLEADQVSGGGCWGEHRQGYCLSKELKLQY